MTGWIILGVIVLVVTLLCLTPVGVYVHYEKELLLQLRIGPFTVVLLPQKEKKPKERKPAAMDAPAKEGEKPAPETAPSSGSVAAKPEHNDEKPEKKKTIFPKPNKAQIVYSLKTLPGILKKALRRTRKGILISPLRVKVVFAGEDPADVAETYGKVQALVSALFPELKKLVRIKNARIALSTDYEREKVLLSLEMGIRLRIGAIFVIAFSAAIGLLRWFIGYRKLAGGEEGPRENTTEEKQDQAKAA